MIVTQAGQNRIQPSVPSKPDLPFGQRAALKRTTTGNRQDQTHAEPHGVAHPIVVQLVREDRAQGERVEVALRAGARISE